MEEQILAVQRMQDFIEVHLNEEITLSDLAQVSFFSPWHSYRLFRRHIGLTPAEYIRRLRLSNSAKILKSGNKHITDIALELGFGSVDGYTRAFFKEFGCNPSEYAKRPIPIVLFIPYGVKFKDLRRRNINMENLQSVFVQVIHKPERMAIIKRGIKATEYMSYCGEVGCDVWGMLASMDSLGGEPVCLWLPQRFKKPNTSTYVQGVEVDVDYKGIIPEGFDTIILPECDYLAFQGEPFEEENFEEAIMAVQEAIRKYDPTIIGYSFDDENPRIQLEPLGHRGYIELRAVKRSK